MKELYKKNNYRTGVKIDGLPYDDRSQAVVLNKGVPIISKVNNEEIGIFNNQRFKVLKYDAFTNETNDKFVDFETALSELEKNVLPPEENNEETVASELSNENDTADTNNIILSVDLKNIIKQELASSN
jgi:hypothetical protein